MKHKIVIFCMIFWLCQGLSVLDSGLFGEEISREVQLRVFYKGQPVENLAKDDFELYENGKLLEILTVSTNSKKISAGSTGDPEKKTPRTFVLIFKIEDFCDSAARSVDYIFDNLLQDDDHLLIIADDQEFQYAGLPDKAKIKSEIKDILTKKSLARNKKLLEVRNIVRAKTRNVVSYYFIEILRDVITMWKEYKAMYLTSDFDWLYRILKPCGEEPGEKWIFLFYQLNIFPHLGMTSQFWNSVNNGGTIDGELYSAFNRTLTQPIRELEKETSVQQELLPLEASKLFYKMNAVLYSFMFTPGKKINTNDVIYPRVRGYIASGFKDLAEASGGAFFHTKNPVKDLESVKDKEGRYYILTFHTETPANVPAEIEIKTKDKKYQVFFDNNKLSPQLAGYLYRLKEIVKRTTPQK